jgi:phage replication O-like protein O
MEQNYLQSNYGYTKINNEILKRFYSSPFNATQIRLILLISRMTGGFHRDSRIFTYGWLAKEANLDRRNVRRSVNLLVQARVIVKTKSGRKNMLGINQNHGSWELCKTHGAKGRVYP